MYRYIVFDVETPNGRNNRMSAIGISVVEDGRIVDRFFSYVDPETYFDKFNIELTGIDQSTVSGAPTFPELWERVEPIMSSGILVAHYAVFDLGVLKACLDAYGIEWQDQVKYCCTVDMGRRLLPRMKHNLNVLCDYYGIELDHHRADSDSNACAQILLRYFDAGLKETRFIKTYRMGKPYQHKKKAETVSEVPTKDSVNITVTKEDLRVLREQKNMMKRDFAKLLGLSQQTYGRYESGNLPIPDSVAKAFKALTEQEGAVGANNAVSADTMEAIMPAPIVIEASVAEGQAAKEVATTIIVEDETVPAKKPVSIFIQSMAGRTITPEEVLSRIPMGCDSVYIKPGDNKAYWVKGDEKGSADLWYGQ